MVEFLKDYTKILGVTGHRPDVLGLPYQANQLPFEPVWRSIITKSVDFLLEYKPDVVLTGMALGYDQWVAELCIFWDIPFIAYVPFLGQESRWPKLSQIEYKNILDKAKYVHVVSPGEYAPWKMQIRNEAIVDDCNHLLACFTGKPGGTANCVKYAIQRNRDFTTI